MLLQLHINGAPGERTGYEQSPGVLNAKALQVDTPPRLAGENPSVRWSSHLHFESVPIISCVEEKEAIGSAFENTQNLWSEHFRLMRHRLVNYRPAGGMLLITSPGPSDGKSLIAHNLAWSLAESGNRTLLLEFDLRRPTQAKHFKFRPPIGTIEILAGEATPTEAVRKVDRVPLAFIGLDKPASDPIKLLRSDAMLPLFAWARTNFTWIVVDAPPVLPVADVENLLPNVDIVAMIVRERWTPRVLAERAAQSLGKRLHFVVLNDVSLFAAAGYGYGYRYGYK